MSSAKLPENWRFHPTALLAMLDALNAAHRLRAFPQRERHLSSLVTLQKPDTHANKCRICDQPLDSTDTWTIAFACMGEDEVCYPCYIWGNQVCWDLERAYDHRHGH